MKLKYRAVTVVMLVVALLAAVSLFTIFKYNRGEIENISRIYDGLIHRLFEVSRTHAPAVYTGGMSRLLETEGVRKALAEGDTENLHRLTLRFCRDFRKRADFLNRVSFYSPDHRLLLPVVLVPGSSRPVVPVKMIGEAGKSGTSVRRFTLDAEGVTYRLVKSVFYGDRFVGVVEFAVNPHHFVESVEGVLDVKGTIVVNESGEWEPGQAGDRLEWKKVGRYYWDEKDAVFRGVLETLETEQKETEITVDDRSYIVYNKVSLSQTGEPPAEVLFIRDITSIKEKKDRSVTVMVVVSILGLALVFVLLYQSFGKLVGKIVERDKELRGVNDELIIYRDYLEGLITEGTRELEIKSQEIEASEVKFRAITTSIRDAIIMVDREGLVSFWNQSAERIFGYSAEEVQEQELSTLIVPDPQDPAALKAFRIFETALADRVVEDSIETEARRKNGDMFPIEITAATVSIQDNPNTVAVMRDITRKKDGEKEIRILSSAVEQSSVMVLITDTEGVIEYVNGKFTEVTGYRREEVLGKTPHILNSSMHKADFFGDLWDTIKAGNEWSGEIYNKKKNGDLYWDATLISPIKERTGEISHFVAVKEDITERKRMEIELLTAKRAAEAASRSKSEFLANMSHELRTPMNAIIGMTDLVLDTRIAKEQREHLEIVQQSSNSLLSLLNDILDLSKIEAGKLALEPVPFMLRKNLGDMARTLSVQAYNKELELVYYIEPEVPDQLAGDVGRLRQVIVNLIGNAIKFTEEGEIVLKIEVLEELPEDKILLHFMISDTGIGIPIEKLDSIFDKFSQADSSTTRKYGGSGLGLAISSKLVSLMEGIIWAESPATFPHFSKSGAGSTFHFTTIFDIDRKAQDVQREFDKKLLKNVSVLIVDDNQTNRKFLEEALSRFGLETESVDSGRAALALLAEKTYQLLILDYQMPEMDGGTVIERVRTDMDSDIPIILLSSGIRSEELDRFIRMGISAHFFKPVNARELLESIMASMGYGEEDAALAEAEEQGAQTESRGAYILVAEDNPINQRLIRQLLEKKGHVVDIAENGRVAVDRFKQHLGDDPSGEKHRMIFMDIQMPEMDGIKATREIRKLDKDIPIVALTAHAMKGDRVKFLAEGMNDYISKPIKKAYLFELLEKYISEE